MCFIFHTMCKCAVFAPKYFNAAYAAQQSLQWQTPPTSLKEQNHFTEAVSSLNQEKSMLAKSVTVQTRFQLMGSELLTQVQIHQVAEED